MASQGYGRRRPVRWPATSGLRPGPGVSLRRVVAGVSLAGALLRPSSGTTWTAADGSDLLNFTDSLDVEGEPVWKYVKYCNWAAEWTA